MRSPEPPFLVYDAHCLQHGRLGLPFTRIHTNGVRTGGFVYLFLMQSKLASIGGAIDQPPIRVELTVVISIGFSKE
jgi:hypothetical protein